MKNVVLIIFGLFTFLNCKPQENKKIKILSAVEFKKAIQSEVQLVDVRTPQECSEGIIKDAKNINIYDADFDERIQKLDKTKPVYVYCKSGGRSQQAAQKMIDLGFVEVFDLKDGYSEYPK